MGRERERKRERLERKWSRKNVEGDKIKVTGT